MHYLIEKISLVIQQLARIVVAYLDIAEMQTMHHVPFTKRSFGMKINLKRHGNLLTIAPAAMDTLCRLFEDTGTVPKDYDFIFTGDLGKFGSDILRDLMAKKGYCLGKNYSDCGVMMYESKQKVEQGGSGCGCGAVTLNTYIADKMEAGVFNKVIFCATGALMSTLTTFQGHTMPSIAHAVILENV